MARTDIASMGCCKRPCSGKPLDSVPIECWRKCTYHFEAVLQRVMGMDDYKTVTVHENTWLALRVVRDQYDYDSMHRFIQEAVLKRDAEADRHHIPQMIRMAIEEKLKTDSKSQQK